MKEICSESLPLIEVVQKFFPDSSRTTLRALFKDERVTVNGLIVKDATRETIIGDEVKIWPKRHILKQSLELLYEDEEFVAVNKPAGLLSVEANYDDINTAHAILKDRYRPGRVFVVHRLDREVSGVMLYARTDATLYKLKEQLKAHKIQREYIALVEGIIKEDKGTWESFLEEDEEYFVKSGPTGEKAITHYEVISRGKNRTHLRIKLQTGRKNQIRVHCSESGHPIVGDKKYGAKTDPFQRLCLHAFRLTLKHPANEKPMVIETPLPDLFFQG